MHNLGLTDLESLEEETLVIPGLDVETAMANSIAKGKKKLRNKRIAQAFSVVSAFVLIAGVSTFAVSTLGSEDSPNRERQSALKVDKNETSTTQAPTTVPETTLAPTTVPVIAPKLISLRTFGNQNACQVPLTPNEDGVMIGSSKQAEPFTAKVGQTFTIAGGNVSSRITMTIKQHSNATNGAYVDLVKGYSANGSYGSITTMGMTYCESGLKMEIKPIAGKAADGTSTYTLSTERW